MIENPESTLTKAQPPWRYTLYSKLQAELINVTTGRGSQLDPKNNHQLYDALMHISSHSPKPIVLTFNAGKFCRGDTEWLRSRTTQSAPGLI